MNTKIGEGRKEVLNSFCKEFIFPNENISLGRNWHLSAAADGCQRVIEPVSRLFFINPATGKSERTLQIKNRKTTNQN